MINVIRKKENQAKRRNLLVVCCGHKSLHREWIDEVRNYDLFIINYEKDDISPSGEEYYVRTSGRKWHLISGVFTDFNFLREYEYIGLFDDDVRFTKGSVNELFESGKALDLTLFQPSIDPVAGFQTVWLHLMTVANSDYRMTNVVEIMVTVLTPEFLIISLEAMKMNREGWGIDGCLWATFLAQSEGKYRAAVIDRLVMEHTRKQFANYNIVEPSLDLRRMINKLELRKSPHYTYVSTPVHPDLQISEPMLFDEKILTKINEYSAQRF